MLKIERTSQTPEIVTENNAFKMTGVCTPENPPKFFELFADGFDRFISYNKKCELIFHLDYFNTGSSKCLLNLFKSVGQKAGSNDVKITWVYETGDEEMREAGELYAEIAEIPFNFVEAD